MVVGRRFTQALLQVWIEPDLENTVAWVYLFGVVDAATVAYNLHIAAFEWTPLSIYAVVVLNRTVEQEGADLEYAEGMLAD